MAEKQDSVSKTATTDEGAYRLHSSDHPGVSLVNHPLVGSNYLAWSTAIKTSLEAKDKIGFVDGSLPPPEDPTEFKKWKTVDSMIKSWIVNSTSKELAKNFIYCQTSKALWDVLEERFGVSNAPQLYEIQRRTSTIEQGEDSVMTYYTKINICWDEMGRLLPIPECTCGKCTCGLHKKITDIDASIKLLQFLMGLNPIYDVIRSQILNLDPLPSANKAYSMVMRVEKQRKINMGILSGNENAAALMAKAYQGKNDGENKGNLIKKKDLSKKDKFCEHCNNTGHTKDTCFKLHGYPDWFKELREKRAAAGKKQVANACGDLVVDASNDSESNTKRELANMVTYLLKEVQRLGKNKAPNTNDEQSNFADLHEFAGNIQPLNPKVINKTNWIMDTGATTHMCSDISLMQNLRILSNPRTVHLPDKTTKAVTKIGSVVLDKNLILKEDQKSKKTLARGAAYGKLYYLTAGSFSKQNRNNTEHPVSPTNAFCNNAHVGNKRTTNTTKTWHSSTNTGDDSDSYPLGSVIPTTVITNHSADLPVLDPIPIEPEIEHFVDPPPTTRESTRPRKAPSWLADYVHGFAKEGDASNLLN
ncbi:uncharacterized protein G2W53_030094 [Senna tora]|uniref:Retrotransposon Copia-like N-terminal domain-containing protein n=1 Tax=Senna tora TaxID=362788 RepID=A0A834WAH5_9FABA|nr:uncharacterized protein G2W53_030094 [Senna tora]